MAFSDEHLEALSAFIREHRSNEANFGKLAAKLDEVLDDSAQDVAVHAAFAAVKEYAGTYQEARERSGSAWPEFEQFVTQFERALISVKHNDVT